MAGAGSKLFTSGSVLLANDVNTYLMDQTIMKFATTTARDAAFGGAGEPTLSEGMFAYTSDTDTLWYYTGSVWQAVLGSNIGTISTSNRNKIINGGFDIWQRGTSFANPASFAYFADRFYSFSNNTGGTVTVSQQTFTAGAAPVAGYEAQFYFRTVGAAPTGATFNLFGQRIEDVRTFAGQTATLSFWAKADTARNVTPKIVQNFGSGGSTQVETSGSAITLTTSWARYTSTFTVPSISGKTIGTSSYLAVEFVQPINVSQTIEYWGIQFEAGSVATPFESEDIGTTLRKCQRYYEKTYNLGTAVGTATLTGVVGNDVSSSANAVEYMIFRTRYEVRKRATPTITTYDSAGNSGKATRFSIVAGPTDNTTSTVDAIGEGSFRVFIGTGLANNAGFVIHYTASAEL